MKAILNTDGGARGNPGPAGIGAILVDEHGEVIASVSESIGATTNNVAEYKALIAGLELAASKQVTQLEVRVDSKLIASQVAGEWKIKKDDLRTLAVKARSLMRRFEHVEITQVPREQNDAADRLANAAMDEAVADPAPSEQGSLLE